jgi:hypothetical protein
MTTKLVFNPTGKIVQIFHENGRLIAQILVHGPLAEVAQNCAEYQPIIKGRPNVFRGELFGLAGYEFLNVLEERIEER